MVATVYSEEDYNYYRKRSPLRVRRHRTLPDNSSAVEFTIASTRNMVDRQTSAGRRRESWRDSKENGSLRRRNSTESGSFSPDVRPRRTNSRKSSLKYKNRSVQPYELKRQRSVPIADNDRSSIHGILVNNASSTTKCDSQATGTAPEEAPQPFKPQPVRTASQEYHQAQHAQTRISRNMSLDSALRFNNASSYRVQESWSQCSSSQESASDRDNISCEGEPQVFACGETSGGEGTGGDENVIGLERALQAVTALTTAPVSRITLYGGLRNTNNTNDSSSVEQQNTSMTQENPHDDSSQNQGLDENYLEQIRIYGTLLRMMGDQFSGDVNPQDFEDYENRVRMLSERQNNH